MSQGKSKVTQSISQRGQFSLTPNEFWTMNISHSAKILYGYIASQSEDWTPGLRAMSEAINTHKSTIAKLLKELQTANMITIVKAKNGLRNHYILEAPEDWTGVHKTTPKIELEDITLGDEIMSKLGL